MQSPVIGEVQFENGQLTVYWPPIQGAESYETTVFENNAAVAGASLTGTRFAAIFTPIPALSATKNYTVKTRAKFSGEWSGYSSPVNVIQNPVTDIVTVFGPEGIHVSWTPPVYGDPKGAVVTMNDTTAPGAQIFQVTISGSSALVPIKQQLHQSDSYTISVMPNSDSGLSKGQSATEPVTVLIPEIKSVAYSAGKITVSPSGTVAPLCIATLYVDGKQGIAGSYGPTKSIIDMSLDPWVQYRVVLQWTNAGKTATGPMSSPVDVATAVPAPLQTSYDSTTLSVRWATPVTATLTTGTQVILHKAGTAVDPQPTWAIENNTATAPVTGLEADSQYTITLAAKRGHSVGPASTSIDVITGTKAIASVSYSGQQLTANWASGNVTGASGYQLILLDGTRQVSVVNTSDTSGFMNVALEGASGFSVALQSISATASGPHSTPVPILTKAPVLSGSTTNVTTGKTSVAWETLSGATKYTVQLMPGQTTTNQDASPYNFADILLANSYHGIRVSGTIVANGHTTISPVSAPFDIPTGQPRLVAVDYDGESAVIEWDLVPEATGYVASLLATRGSTTTVAGHTTAKAGQTSTTISFNAPEAGTTYKVVVQTQFNTDSGPVSEALPLFKAGFFLSSSAYNIAVPYLYPATKLATVSSPPTAEAISLYFPNLANAPLTGLPKNIGSPTQVFVLQANTGPQKAIYPYEIKIDISSPAWSFDTSAVRPAIKQAVPALLVALEAAGAKPWGISMVQDSLARYLPQTFQESLLLAYGMDGSTSACDIRPGMVLRAGVNTSQLLGFAENQQWLNGYTAGTVLEYDIGSFVSAQGDWSTGFDNFISELVVNGLLTVKPPEEGQKWNQLSGAADIADLYYANFPSSFYRLLPPQTLANTTQAASSDTTKQFVIAAATSYTDILTATNTTGKTCPITYFRGRSIIRMAIRVVLNGTEITVPVGTTVANLLERSGSLPALAATKLTGITVERSLGAAVTDTSHPLSVSNSYHIRFDWKDLFSYLPGWTGLSLPLMPGDSISTRE